MIVHCNSDWCDYSMCGVCTADEIIIEKGECISGGFSIDLDVEISEREEDNNE